MNPELTSTCCAQGYSGKACCVDLTDDGSEEGDDERNRGLGSREFVGRLAAGVNFWSGAPLTHNDEVYNQTFSECLQSFAATSEPLLAQTAACNAKIVAAWRRDGVMIGSGRGRRSLIALINKLLGGLQNDPLIASLAGASATAQGLREVAGFLARALASQTGMRCVLPRVSNVTEAHMRAGDFALGVDTPTLASTGGGEKCLNLQEGLAIIAKYERFSEALHPPTEPKDIPECSAAGQCQQRSAMVRGEERFLRGGGRWAQVCDLFLSDALEVLSGAVMSSIESSDSLAALVALNQIPCACRWLLFAQRLSGSVLLPSGPEASLTMPRPDPYNCPKDAGTGLYTCDVGEQVCLRLPAGDCVASNAGC